ncbi:MAG: hypothetical protein Fur0018_11480 [Anaerolineales bacterium]
MRLHLALPGIVLIMLGANACRPQASGTPPVFIPPTAESAAAVQANRPSGVALAPQATATPQCQTRLHYLEDLSLPDGSLVQPGELLDKRWAVENDGSCNWDESYSLRWIAGPTLGAPERLPLYPARAGTTAIIRVLFTAPQAPGVYRSAWQAYDAHGNPFGDPVFIEIQVGSP